MSLRSAGAVAGVISTVLFVGSYLPMLVKAARTRDLSSYSIGNLAVANIGNVVHTVYVVSLPIGPIWALHGFYLAASAVMLWWWFRYRDRTAADSPEQRRQMLRDGNDEGGPRPGSASTFGAQGGS